MPSLVWQVVRLAPNEVGGGVLRELHGVDGRASLEQRPGRAMPAIHHRTIRGEDDRKREIRLVHQCRVFDESTPRDGLSIMVEYFIERTNLAQGHGANGQRA